MTHRITRRRLLTATAAGAAALSAPAVLRAQTVFAKPIVAALNAPAGNPTHTSVARIPEIMMEATGMEANIQIYPPNSLGNDVNILESVQTGFVDIASNTTAQFSAFDGSFNFVDLPYAIPDWDTALRLFKSDLWMEQMEKFEAAVPTLKVLPPVGAGGFRLLWNDDRPLRTPADVDGLKFRSTGSPIGQALFRAWNGNPTPISFFETQEAIKNGVVDGFHVQPIWTYEFNFQEVLRYATKVDAIFAVQFQVMNRTTWDAMPEDFQTAFWDAAVAAADEANAADRALEADYEARLIEAGMEVYMPTDDEKAEWVSAGEALWDEFAGDIDPAVIDKLVALRS
ncbi:MAG: TRAP transporter substrate-binding protein [Pseudomonadota bacterium]